MDTRSCSAPAPDSRSILISRRTFLSTRLKDFAPISLIYSAPLFLVTRPDLPASSVVDLVALAKREPGKLNYASGGVGHSSHLAGELLKTLAGINLTHVPYQGTAPAIRDVMAGHVDLMFIASGVQYADKGQVKLLGVTGAKRSAAAPDLPTLAEAGIPGYSATAWFGLLAPASVPQDVVLTLSEILKDAIKTGALQEKVRGNAAEMDFVGTGPDEFREFIQSEFTLWQGVLRANKIEAQ